MDKIKSRVQFLIGWPLSIIAILFIIRFLINNTSRININISDINPYFFVTGIVMFALYFLVRGLVWKKLMEYFGHQIDFSDNLYLWAFSEVKRYIPGSIWSFLSRASLFSQRNVEKKKIFMSLLFEFELVVIACAILSIPSIYFIVSQFKLNTLLTYLFILFTVLSVVVFLYGNKLRFGLSKYFPPFGITKNINLVILGLISFLFFGLGTYFCAASLFNLRNLSPLILIGFFNFSLLIGYLSIITPMGLGVREAIVTIGLSSVMGVYEAGALAIFTRLSLVFSEAIFLGSVLSFTKHLIMVKFLKKFRWEVILVLGIIIYNLYFTTASILRYENYYTGRFDLGNMAQTVWNTSRGEIFQLTNPNGTEKISRLAFHADFILILLTPLYMVWSDPRMLLVIQTLILSLGSIFVYLISKSLLNDRNISLILGLSYLLFPAVEFANLYDFHPVTLATTLLLASIYFLVKKKYILVALFLALSGLTKENIWLINFLLGIYIIFFHKKRIFGVAIASLSFVIFYYLVWHAIPQALGGQHFALAYYSDFGTTPLGIIKNVLFSPLKTLNTALGHNQLIYLRQIFIPLGYTSFFSPFFLIFTAPTFAINLLSNNPQLHQIYYQYASDIVPFVFMSSIFGIRYLTNKIKEIPIYAFTIAIIIFTSLSSYLYGPLPFSKEKSINMFIKPLHNGSLIDSYLSHIPGNSSIASTNNLGSHLSEREKIYTIPLGIDRADYVMFLLNDDDFNSKDIAKTLQIVKQDKKYSLIFSQSNFFVFKKLNLTD